MPPDFSAYCQGPAIGGQDRASARASVIKRGEIIILKERAQRHLQPGLAQKRRILRQP